MWWVQCHTLNHQAHFVDFLFLQYMIKHTGIQNRTRIMATITANMPQTNDGIFVGANRIDRNSMSCLTSLHQLHLFKYILFLLTFNKGYRDIYGTINSLAYCVPLWHCLNLMYICVYTILQNYIHICTYVCMQVKYTY